MPSEPYRIQYLRFHNPDTNNHILVNPIYNVDEFFDQEKRLNKALKKKVFISHSEYSLMDNTTIFKCYLN